jgi:hypothetical protein
MYDHRAAELHHVARVPLLPGEMDDSGDRDDVEHWVAVYEQLIGFLNEFDAPDEMQRRYQRRLRFWRRRYAGLADPDSENGQLSEAVE